MRFDAIVIGGGPSGSSAAISLSKAGLETLLLEKFPKNRMKPCAGGIGPRICEMAQLPKSIVSRSVGRVNVYSCNNNRLSINLKKDNATVRREEFDGYLLQRAEDCGAKVIAGCPVAEILRDGEKFSGVKTSKGEVFNSDFIVAADGVGSLMNGFRSERHLLAIAKEYELAGVDEDDYHIFYFEGLPPLGYGWLIPKDGFATVGVLGFLGETKSISEKLDYLVKQHPVGSELCKNGKVSEIKGALIPFKPMNTIRINNMLGAGDAIGATSPLTGGGIYYAMLSGELAGKAIASHVHNNEPLDNYEKQWFSTHGKTIRMQYAFARILRKMWTDRGWDDAIKKISADKNMVETFADSWSTYSFSNRPEWFKIISTCIFSLAKNRILG